MAFLQIDNFYKSFGKTNVLQGVSFEMEKDPENYLCSLSSILILERMDLEIRK